LFSELKIEVLKKIFVPDFYLISHSGLSITVLAKRRFGWNWKPGVLNKGNLKRLDSS